MLAFRKVPAPELVGSRRRRVFSFGVAVRLHAHRSAGSITTATVEKKKTEIRVDK